MSETWGHPEPPPPLRHPGQIITRFRAYIDGKSFGYDTSEQLTIRLTVPMTETFKGLLLREHKGYELNVEVRRPQTPTVDIVGELLEEWGADEEETA